VYCNMSVPKLTNCILWGDSATGGSEIDNGTPGDGEAFITYSDVDGALWHSNINADRNTSPVAILSNLQRRQLPVLQQRPHAPGNRFRRVPDNAASAWIDTHQIALRRRRPPRFDA